MHIFISVLQSCSGSQGGWRGREINKQNRQTNKKPSSFGHAFLFQSLGRNSELCDYLYLSV